MNDAKLSIQGYVHAHGGLRLYEDRNFVVRKEPSAPEKVKLIAGGGSGHEPAHAGYVGSGMLDGAVCGDVFAAPSTQCILDCLRAVAVSKEDEVIFIVNNYTGDRLNFGLALERAKLEYGYTRVYMLLNDDDCSIDEAVVCKSVGKRGLAGSIPLIKILGAMAEQGKRADELFEVGKRLVSERIGTFGFTFEMVEEELRNVELGKGLHGEPGVYKREYVECFEFIVMFILNRLATKIESNSEVVVFVNNLGGVSEFTIAGFMLSLTYYIEQTYTVKEIHCGTFFSSMNQSGISVTVVDVTNSEELLSYLNYSVHVACPLFGYCSYPKLPLLDSEIVRFEDEFKKRNETKVTFPRIFNDQQRVKFKAILRAIATALIDSRQILNDDDKEYGDGDTGNTIASGATALLEKLPSEINFDHPAAMLQDISCIVQSSMGGTSGAIYSLFLQAASKAFFDCDETNDDANLSIEKWLHALHLGNEAIIQYALSEVGDRTMLDPLRQAELALEEALKGNQLTEKNCMKLFATVCANGAKATLSMQAKSGRAAYSAAAMECTHISKCPDPGAHAVEIWSKAMSEKFCNDGDMLHRLLGKIRVS